MKFKDALKLGMGIYFGKVLADIMMTAFAKSEMGKSMLVKAKYYDKESDSEDENKVIGFHA